jgi:hypothetical protein
MKDALAFRLEHMQMSSSSSSSQNSCADFNIIFCRRLSFVPCLQKMNRKVLTPDSLWWMGTVKSISISHGLGSTNSAKIRILSWDFTLTEIYHFLQTFFLAIQTELDEPRIHTFKSTGHCVKFLDKRWLRMVLVYSKYQTIRTGLCIQLCSSNTHWSR